MIYYIIFVFLLAVLFFAASYDGICKKEYIVYTSKVNKEIKISLISDLHSMYCGKNHSTLFKFIKQENPDFIVLAGDIFDGKRKDTAAVEFLEKLPRNIRSFYVTGNHEHKNGRWKEYLKCIKENGITVLDSDTVRFEKLNISFSGIFDYNRSVFDDVSFSVPDAIEKIDIDEDEFNILVAHTPFLLDTYLKKNFDLILSGHTHGGQIRIPLILNGLYNRGFRKRLGFFPPYCGGEYRHGNLTHIVSRGVSNNPAWMPRIFNRKEFVNVIIRSYKN